MPFRSIRRPLVLALAAALAGPIHLQAQGPQGPLWDSYRRAEQVLRAGAEAHGGLAAIRAIGAASFRWEGLDYAPTQSRIPTASWDTAGNGRAVVQDVRVDYARGRFAVDREAHFPGGYVNAFRTVGSGRELLAYNPLRERGMGGVTFQRDTTGAAARRTMSSVGANMPVLLIRMALARATTLRYLGERTDRGRREHAIAFTTAEGDAATLYFDAGTNLLSRREEMGIGSLGDEVDAYLFSDYETVGGFAVPRAMELRWNGLLTGRQRLVRFAAAAELPDSLLRVPDGYTPAAPGGAPAAVRIADGMHYLERIGGSHRSLVVDTEEGLVVVDAPVSVDASEAAIRLIEQTHPGRPIRYVVITHHHGDHIAGIAAFAARGATVLASAGSEAYLRRMATVPRTLGVLAPTAVEARIPAIEAVAGRRVIGRGPRRVEVIDVGPTSHAAAMLAVYVPAQRLLFQGDLLRINEGSGPVVSPEATRDLHRIIRRFRLDVTSIGAVHGVNGTMDDLRRALASATDAESR